MFALHVQLLSKQDFRFINL